MPLLAVPLLAVPLLAVPLADRQPAAAQAVELDRVVPPSGSQSINYQPG